MVSTNLPHFSELQYNVAGLLQETAGGMRTADVHVPISRLDQLDESVDVVAPFVGTVRLLKASTNVLARLVGETTVRLTCARCLEPFSYVLHIDLEEEFRPSVDINSGAAITDTGDDLALVINKHHVLDMTEILRQAMLLSLPLPPLCREDCQGLCPDCGANLNEESCNCQNDDIDPRWAALSALIVSDSDINHPE